jgi:ABC-type branched-subunit amino acid transport system substrate-binding protein
MAASQHGGVPVAGGGTRRYILRAAAGAAGGVLFATLFAACSSNGPADLSTGSVALTEAPAFDKKKQIKVALIVPLSAQGHTSVIGKSLKQAAELALFERDNPNLQLIIKDDKGTPEGARAAAEEAVKGGATLILGPLFAKSATAVAPIARQAGIPVIAFSNDRQVAGHGVYLLSFQPAPEVVRIVAYATQQGKRRFAALIPDDSFGRIVAASFKDAVAQRGGSVAVLETYQPTANAMLEPMRKVSEAIQAAEAESGGVDTLFVPGAQENLEMIARLLPQAEIDTGKIKLIGTGGMDYPNAGRDPKLLGAWYPGPDPRGWNDFSQKYAKSYGQAPPRIASLAYDAVSVAIALAGAPEGERYTAATLTRAGGFAGVDGAFRLLPDGTTDRALAILEVKNFGANIIDPPSSPVTAQPPAVSNAVPGVLRGLFNLN